MKATYEQVSENIDNAFLYRQFSLPKFNAPYHFHPELELTLILKSSGRRFVGRQINDFEAGDLVLLGENVPHCWLNTVTPSRDEANGIKGVGESAPNAAESIVIQFLPKIISSDFKAPELKPISQLLKNGASGILIKGKTRDWVADKMIANLEAHPFKKLVGLLEILCALVDAPSDLELIDNSFSVITPSMVQTERIQKIYAYIIENYQNDIDLNTISTIAHLTPTAFCRYFKKMTRKTLVDVITEFRIKHARQLLTSTERSVSDICFESGFGNISYFNKEFKKAIGHSPLNYRKLYVKLN
jgi:AraC-like DNA-binding protein